jgi:hypothetical protein
MTVNNEKWGLGNINVILGGILVSLGVLFFLGQMFGINLGRFVWPFFVIVPGVLLFIFALAARGSAGEGLAVIGSIVTMLGTLLLYQNTTGHWESWAYAWALVAPTSIGLGQIVYGSLKSQQHVVATGKRLAPIGIAIFLAGAIFFELIIGISGFGLGRFLLPMLLIGFGGLFLARSLLFNRG